MKRAAILYITCLILFTVNAFGQVTKTYTGQKGAIRIEHDKLHYDIEMSMSNDSYFIKITNNSNVDLGVDENKEEATEDRGQRRHHVLFMLFDFDNKAANNVRIGKGENLVLNFKRNADVKKYVVRLELFNREALLNDLKSKNIVYRIDKDHIKFHKQVAIFGNYELVRKNYDEISVEFNNGKLPDNATVSSY